jgi:hypothetical protein
MLAAATIVVVAVGAPMSCASGPVWSFLELAAAAAALVESNTGVAVVAVVGPKTASSGKAGTVSRAGSKREIIPAPTAVVVAAMATTKVLSKGSTTMALAAAYTI